MNTLNETELMEVNGGIGWGDVFGPYYNFLKTVEAHPQDYTWTMDWYYSR